MTDNMMKTMLPVAAALALLACGCKSRPEGVETLSDNSIKVTTEVIGADIRGFSGPVPVEVYITDGRIDSVVALPNDETPRYFNRLRRRGLLNAWDGLTVEEALAADVDGVTGATYSSRALIRNVHLALEQASK